MLNNEKGNIAIKEVIESGKIFMAGRVGLTEVATSYSYDKGIALTDQQKYMLSNNAGVYGSCFDEFSKAYIDAIASSDIQVQWPINSLAVAQKYLFSKYCPSATLVENRAVEPFYFNEPWSYALKEKKVLVISPFAESIEKQFKKRDKIWRDDVLPEMELSVYKNVQSIGNSGPHSSWIESLEKMKEDISSQEFDVALLGCGAYGMPLGAFIKNKMNRSSVYVGGGLQLLFGIKGKRWDSHEEISKFFNEHWTRPLENERPAKAQTVEGGCYW